MAQNFNIVDYTSFTVASTAGTMFGLADSGMVTTKPASAKSFMGMLATNSIRARGEGNPTTTEGELINPGDTIVLGESEMTQMAFINGANGSSGVVKGHFYTCEAAVLLGGKG